MATAWSLSSIAFGAGLRPEPDLLISQWADRYRIVAKPSPEEGPWRTDRVPYAREIMDRFAPSDPAEIIVLQKAAQGAGTEILLNVLGCVMHRYPDSALLVLPTVNTAKKFVRTRLDRMIESTPVLRDVVAPARSRTSSNTMSVKEFAGATLIITGANSGPDLRSYPSRYALCDEVDGYPPDLDKEGDPTELILQRTAAFRGRKVGFISTPTHEATSVIAKWYARGDQRVFYVPCPACGHMQPLVWGADRIRDGRPGGLRWPKGQPDQARYECERCGERWEEWRKIELLKRGEWQPSASGNGGGKIRSYKVNALYYPYGWPGNAWPNLAAAWESDHGDPIKLRTFVNLKLAEAYRDPSEAQTDAASLYARRETYGPEIPAGASVLAAGIDVQADRLELELVAWGPGEESWSIEYRVIPGDTSRLTSPDAERKSPWQRLDEYLLSEFMSELGVGLHIKACCIDSSYNRQVVTQFCGERTARRVWAIQGRAGQHPVWSTRARRQRGKWPPAQIVGVDAAKERIYASLRIAEPGPSFCHFPATEMHSKHYFEMLTAEVRVPDYSGSLPRFEWRKRTAGARNEALDARVYAYGAIVGLQMQHGLRLADELARLKRAAEKGAQAGTEKASWRERMRPIVADNPYLN